MIVSNDLLTSTFSAWETTGNHSNNSPSSIVTSSETLKSIQIQLALKRSQFCLTEISWHDIVGEFLWLVNAVIGERTQWSVVSFPSAKLTREMCERFDCTHQKQRPCDCHEMMCANPSNSIWSKTLWSLSGKLTATPPRRRCWCASSEDSSSSTSSAWSW